MATIKVNVGLDRAVRKPGRRMKIECRNIGGVEFEGDWENQEDHIAFREKVILDNPGWNVSGYARVKNGNDS